jgi:hypothetical protein
MKHAQYVQLAGVGDRGFVFVCFEVLDQLSAGSTRQLFGTRNVHGMAIEVFAPNAPVVTVTPALATAHWLD